MAEFLANLNLWLSNYAGPIIGGAFVCLLLELLWPVTPPTLASRMRGGLFTIVNIVFAISVLMQYNKFIGQFHIHPLISIDLGGLGRSENILLRPIGWIGAPIAAAIIGDFFYYWQHRLQHSNSFLWRFHAVHHSIRQLSAWTNYTHFTEVLFRLLFVVLPQTFLISVDAGYVPLTVAFFFIMQNTYTHSSTKVHLGLLRYVIVDNRFHRIHHAIDGPATPSNFGSFTSIWDVLFGTAHFPRRSEWPATGLVEQGEPSGFADFLLRPFRRLSA